MPDAGHALRTAANVGPYFAVDLHADGPSWRPFADLVEEGTVLRDRVEAVRATLAQRTGLDVDAVDERATASLHSLALTARLIAPAFAAAVLTGTVPMLDVAGLRWQEAVAGPVPVAFLDPPATVADRPEQMAGLLDAGVIRTVVAPLVGVFGTQFRLSGKVLWGNVASALGGAATMLATVEGGRHAQGALRLAEDMVATGLLRGYGRYVRPWPERPERFFVRHNCCLFYRIPGGGTCGDCVLVPDDARLAMWQEQAGVIG
jgi:ferric iron reductase protein FhuF